MPTNEFDIVVIGSGPAGATTARVAAEQGLKVLLVDKRQELGAPIQCSGAISRHALIAAGVEPNKEFIHEAIYGFGIYNQDGEKTTIDYRQIKPDEYGQGEGQHPLGYLVDRRRFDRYLMAQAVRAGVEVQLKTEGLGYQPTQNGGCHVQLRQFNKNFEVKAQILVGADGVQSQVGKWAGMQTHIKLKELASCLQYVVEGVETNGLLEIVTGQHWAPGGYAWVFPKGTGYAEIGLGVTRNLTTHDAQWHLNQFIHQSFFKERFKNYRILEIQGGGVPLAAPLKTQYADNLILVGDAARHVNPITGGGIHTALHAGNIAGNFMANLLQSGQKPNKKNLKGYQDQWLEETGNAMWKLYREKTSIFREKDIAERDRLLYKTMSAYFSPYSEYKKI